LNTAINDLLNFIKIYFQAVIFFVAFAERVYLMTHVNNFVIQF